MILLVFAARPSHISARNRDPRFTSSDSDPAQRTGKLIIPLQFVQLQSHHIDLFDLVCGIRLHHSISYSSPSPFLDNTRESSPKTFLLRSIPLSTGRKRLYLGMRNEREIYDRLSVSALSLCFLVRASLANSNCLIHSMPLLAPEIQLELVKNSSLDPATLPSSSINSTSSIAQSKPNSSARNPGKIPFDMKQLDAAQKRRFIMLKGKKDRLERELSKLS
jgi:hypothetical protein